MKSRSYVEKVAFKDSFPERKIEQKYQKYFEVVRKTNCKSVHLSDFDLFSMVQKEKSSIENDGIDQIWGFRKELKMTEEIIDRHR